LAPFHELKIAPTILALKDLAYAGVCLQNPSTAFCIAPSRFCHEDDPLQRQRSFEAIPDDIQHNLGVRKGVSEKTAVYMIDVLNWMCSGGCATYDMSV